jgi:protein-tyrosine phosphatase
MFNRILVVCAGNICRSPLGEALLAQLLPHATVTSAGLVAKEGDSAADHSIDVAKDDGIDVSNHQARRLSDAICAENDLILVMEPQHMKDVAAKFPQASGKTMLLGKWIGVDIIPDPHRQSREAFDHAYDLIKQSCVAWSKRLAGR